MIVSLIALAAVSPSARGQPAAAEAHQGPTVWQMNVSPRPVTPPALEHALLPSAADRTPGNAATLYLIAAAHARTVGMPQELAKKGLPTTDEPDLMGYFLSLPLEKLPADEVETFLRGYTQSLQTFDVAVRRDYCRWDLAIRERGMDQAFTHLNDARELANVISLRARLQMARGQNAEAARSVAGIFRYGSDLAQEGMLIDSLVGVGIAAIGVDRLRELAGRPAAPNLYWPLATLPRPFVSLASAMDRELAGVLATFPGLARADEEPMSAEAWNQLVLKLPTLSLGTRGALDRKASVAAMLGPAALGTALYPEAKRYLAGRGVPQAEVDAMPVAAALGRYVLGIQRTHFNEVTAWSALPYPQALPLLLQKEETFQARHANTPAWYFLYVVPAASRAAGQFAILDRQLTAVQTVEAIRAHAASVDGRLPARLEDLRDTPAPMDPVTGKPFAYRVEGARAIIESPAPAGTSARSALRIELTVTK